ncbi:MAG: hypothetical protein MJ025_01045 [Victivallaceae bacterium]|nr:hypothetical protein [Victivallaceae bacterium]
MNTLIAILLFVVWFVVFSVLVAKYGADRVWKWCIATFVAVTAAGLAIAWFCH